MDWRSTTFFAVTMALMPIGTEVQATGQPVSLMNCRSGTMQVLVRSPGLTLMAIEHTGVHTGFRVRNFENSTNHCIGTLKVIDGERSGNGFCRNVDPDGDATYVEWTMSAGEGSWQFIGGTGKWTGIRGGGESREMISGQPVLEGTYQGCVRVTGEYSVPD